MARIDDPDLTRKQRREQARSERRAVEETERASAESRKRFTQIAGALIVVAVIGIIVALVATSGSKKASGGSASNASANAQAGLLETPPPWPPQYSGLLNRIVGNHFPPYGSNYHVHAVLRVYAEGRQIEVPSQIGIDRQEEFLAPLHTHDTSGIIHMEATEPYPFKLSQFFTVWGVKFTNSQLGAFKTGGGKQLAVFANGSQVASPTSYVIKPHDRIVVDYGNPKTFVKEFQFTFPAGL